LVKSRIKFISLSILVVAIIAAVWWFWGREDPLPEGLIQANGRIEGDRCTVASKVAGQVKQLLVREGDAVEGGQVLIQLDDVQMRAKVEQARQGLKAAQAQLNAATLSEQQARRDAERMRELLTEGTITKHESEQAELAWSVAKHQLQAAEAQRNLAQATLDEVSSILDDMTIRAPAGGVITTRTVDVGELVAAGAPLLDIVDLDRLYLKVYIPEKEIGKVRLGLNAQVYTDAFPDTPFAASVCYIASRAEFTPKEVQTPDERVKLVYAVKLYLKDNPQQQLTPGLPADAVIRWKEDVPWAKPRW
jgi:HlyD family secretion protein